MSALVAGLLVCNPAVASAQTSASRPDATELWSDWRLPLPAGAWRITRGPCGAASEYDHECGYYENSCALDFVPLTGSMESVPVLAPANGVVFFVGTRENTGLMLMLRHPDGRVSGYMHLARIVTPRDTAVTRGQVLGYAGTTGTAQAHLHFWVQPDAVQRSCLDLTGYEQQDLATGRAISSNLSWNELILVDPPSALPEWLPLLGGTDDPIWRLPARVVLAPGRSVVLPVAIRATLRAGDALVVDGAALAPFRQVDGQALFQVPIQAPSDGAGRSALTLTLRAPNVDASAQAAALVLGGARPTMIRGSAGALLVNPTFVSPANYGVRTGKAELCWSIPLQAGQAPLRFRALIVRDPAAAPAGGLVAAESGWQSGQCWTTPRLAPGTYLWKVFVTDGTGLMNRTNQRPQALVIQ